MKKCLFMGAMAAMLLGTASCSSDMEPAMGGETPVSFSINLGDDIDSRTISDGTGANTLKFAVFENGTEIPGLAQTVTVADKKATINTRLVKGHTYSFVFWAQNSECKVYNTDDMRAIKVDYKKIINGNDETRDAFYKVEKDVEVNEAIEKTVVLTRPFAQINFLAKDAAGVNNLSQYTTQLTVPKVPTQLNTLDGTVGGELVDVTFTEVPVIDEVFAGYEDYQYVSMDYILVGEQKELKDKVTLKVKDENGAEVNNVEVANCPVQRNYRTNIFGDIYTLAGKFNVIIVPHYWKPDYLIDGEIDPEATYYEVNEDTNFADLLATINAEQPEKVVVKVADGVTLTYTIPSARYAMIDATNTGTKSIVFEGAGWENSTFHVDGNGVEGVKVTSDALVTFKNIKITDDTRYNYENGNNAWEFAYLEMEGNMMFKNVYFADGIQADGSDMVFLDCFFISDGNAKRDPAKQNQEYAVWLSEGNYQFLRCEFTGYRGPKLHSCYGTDVKSVSFDECYFHDISVKPGVVIGNLKPSTTVSIKNSTFKNCQPGDQKLYIYESDTNVANFNFINENNTIINE